MGAPCARFCSILLASLCFCGIALAAPRLQCSVASSSAIISAGRAAGFKDISVTGDGCTGVTTSASSSVSTEVGDSRVEVASKASLKRIRPFRVTGGDEEEDTVVVPRMRPVGGWGVLIDSQVALAQIDVWFQMSDFGNCLFYGLQGIGAEFRSLDSEGTQWLVLLENGEEITFVVTETNNEKFYHVVQIASHSANVFPGVDISGTQFFFQFIEKATDVTIIEFGWGGDVVSGPADVAVIAVGALGQEWLENLETKFGESCVEGKSIRTIEGDCNNLGEPRRGAAGHALVRLGGADPAFPNGDPTQPSGPVHISPRVISNKLCAQSPGAVILEANAEKLKGQCARVREGFAVWTICPYESASFRHGPTKMNLDWTGYTTLDDGSLELHFVSDECQLDMVLGCHGTTEAFLMDSPCGNKGNMFLHPTGCLIRPGEDDVLSSSHDMTDMFWTFGQFVDHDLDLTPVTQIADKKQPGFSKNSRKSTAEELPIEVPEGDFFMEEDLEFERTTLLSDQRLGLHENQHSAYADLGQVYGVDYLRAQALRTFTGGKLKVSAGDLPPYNKIDGPGALRAKVDNAPDAGDEFFAVGDIRGNEQTLLLAMHIIWMREHNLICDELAAQFPYWTDEQIYQTARAVAIAEYQSILYDEWLPLLLGEGVAASSDYRYDSAVDPSITAVFSTAAFRFGHTLVGSFLWKLGPGPKDSAHLERVPLRRLFFNPSIVQTDGVDAFLRGAAWHRCKDMDAKVVDELRNFLFAEDETKGHMDLVSLNLQRGRDMGLPTFNSMRGLYGLPPYSSFSEFIEDEHLAGASTEVYEGDVDQCDALYGGFAETPVAGSLVGQTFHTIIADQFIKIRDGDRFFFKALEWDPELVAAYPRISDIMAGRVKLAQVITRNCGVTDAEIGNYRDSVFQL